MHSYDLAINLIVTIATIMVFFALFVLWWYIFYFFISGKKIEVAPHNKSFTKFAIIIPARDESKVIRKIFNSLKEQTYPKNHFDVWVIVEDFRDQTVDIAKEYGFNFFVRDNLTSDRHTKGFAIQELIEFFKRNNLIYDSYMFFDADNIVDKNYIEAMNDLRGTGVKVGVGYRAFTNPNTNWLTCCSATMFAWMNQVTSRGRSYMFHKVTLMGTGYYVDKDIIDDAGGWKFTGMAEDIQLTAYCYYHDVYMRYYPLVNFYDEQSPKYKDAHNQHIRWLMGFLAKRHYLKKFGVKYTYHTKLERAMMRSEFRGGLVPFIIYNIVNAILLFASLGVSIAVTINTKDTSLAIKCYLLTAYQFLVLYLPFVIASTFIMIKDHKNLNFKTRTKIWCALTYFFFYMDFVIAFFQGIFSRKKRTTWEKIEHTGEIN